MHKQQLSQVSELTNGDISAPRRLKTLNPTDANADVRRLDHGDVVGTVADGQQDCFEISLDELDDQRFLQGRDTTFGIISFYADFLDINRYIPANHSFAHYCKVEKHLLHIPFQSICQRLAINNESQRV